MLIMVRRLGYYTLGRQTFAAALHSRNLSNGKQSATFHLSTIRKLSIKFPTHLEFTNTICNQCPNRPIMGPPIYVLNDWAEGDRFACTCIHT